GAKVAFSAFGGAQTARIEVRVKDTRTGADKTVPVQGINVGQVPRLSPDGSLLAYRDVVDGKARTYVIAPGASVRRELCEDCTVFGFFPDNDHALVRSKPGELETMDLQTKERTVALSAGPDVIEDASLSPDGKWIAWLAGEPDGRAAVRISPVKRPQTGAPNTITVAEAGYYLGSPAWSPNGRWLYYLSEKDGDCSLFVRELDPRTKEPAGDERKIPIGSERTINLNFPKGNGAIGVAADRIVFEATVMIGNIYLARPKKR
ncbi:MAG: TolB family protein, partial [Candidatus Aminicenantes bacterium RBG_16_66_30]